MKNRPSIKFFLFISSFDVYNPRVPSSPPLGAYLISKTALHQRTHFLAFELRNFHIRVNCIAAGPLNTKFSETLRMSITPSEEIFGIHRLGKPQDISNTAAFLCSDEAEFINGEIIVVGGYPSSRLYCVSG